MQSGTLLFNLLSLNDERTLISINRNDQPLIAIVICPREQRDNAPSLNISSKYSSIFLPSTFNSFPFTAIFPRGVKLSYVFCGLNFDVGIGKRSRSQISFSLSFRDKSATILHFLSFPRLKLYRSSTLTTAISSLCFLKIFIFRFLRHDLLFSFFFFFMYSCYYRGYENANVRRWKLFFAELATREIPREDATLENFFFF